MSDQYRNFGKDFPPIIQSQYNVPPPGFSTQNQSGGYEKTEKWDNDPFPTSRGFGGFKGNKDDSGNYKDRDDGNNRSQFDYGDKNRGTTSRFGSGGNNNKGSFNKGNSAFPAVNNDMITQEDTIFVSGMDPSVSESDIHSHFGAIGIIKKDKKTMKPKIWLYKNKETGLSKGEATVTYDDINAAQSAISWFDGRDFNGSVIKVSLAQRQNNWSKPGSGRKAGFSGARGNNSGQTSANPTNERFNNRTFDRGGSDNDSFRDDRGSRTNNQSRSSSIQQRDGDWKCAECSNTNFAWRNECNRCKSPKSDGGAAGGGGSGGGGGGGGGGGNNSYDRPNFKNSTDNSNRGQNRSGFSRGGGNRRDGAGPIKNNNGTGGSRSKPY